MGGLWGHWGGVETGKLDLNSSSTGQRENMYIVQYLELLNRCNKCPSH